MSIDTFIIIISLFVSIFFVVFMVGAVPLPKSPAFTSKKNESITYEMMQKKYNTLMQQLETLPKDTDTGGYIVANEELAHDIEEWNDIVNKQPKGEYNIFREIFSPKIYVVSRLAIYSLKDMTEIIDVKEHPTNDGEAST